MIPEKQNKKIVKDYSSYEYIDIDDKDFSIKPLKKMRLIDTLIGLDDECEFEKNGSYETREIEVNYYIWYKIVD